MPPNRIGRGPKRSTTKPDSACTAHETTKKTVSSEAELGVADVEGVLEQEEERRQQQLAEVADAMGQADEAHHGGVAARRRHRREEAVVVVIAQGAAGAIRQALS